MLNPPTPPMPQGAVLETARLHLRLTGEDAYCKLLQTESDAFLKAHFGFGSDEALQAQRAKVEGGFSTHRTSVFFVHLMEKGTGTVVGSFAYHNWYPTHSRSEIGYEMSAPFKNKGFMKEAFPGILAFGFGPMELNRIEAFIHPDNQPSRRLVERAGFRQEGLLQEHYCHNGITGDSLVYGLLKKEYAQNR